jgi:hypothetical protein
VGAARDALPSAGRHTRATHSGRALRVRPTLLLWCAVGRLYTPLQRAQLRNGQSAELGVTNPWCRCHDSTHSPARGSAVREAPATRSLPRDFFMLREREVGAKGARVPVRFDARQDSESLTPQERYDFANFAALLTLRVPQFRDSVKKFRVDLARITGQVAAAHPGYLERGWKSITG